jgi:DNA replication initiation complex subunit (GINS family)
LNIEKEYNKLYSHWLDEFEQAELTILSKDLINYYNRILSQLKDYKKTQQNLIKDQLIDSYRENYKFLVNDFLKIREVKIINFALALKEINFSHILEVEKLFYQKLISSFKGFKKMRIFTIYDDVRDEEVKLEVEEATEVARKVEEVVSTVAKDTPEETKSETKIGNDDIQYTLIRFIKKAPPLVGFDFLNYGPFEKENIAYIPLKNAKILISEKFAELINISS